MRPVCVAGSKPVIQGLPLVPPVNPAQPNLSWSLLWRVV
jgi:hypothetical protein